MKNIKSQTIIYFIFAISFITKADVLTDFQNEMEKKVQLGMTTTEVRKILGPPKAVESGFPKSKDLIINEIPDLVGQLNASTWFYFFLVPKLCLGTQLSQKLCFVVCTDRMAR